MTRNIHEVALSFWAFCVGAALWVPAIGLQFGFVFLQPMDLLALAGIPLVIVFIPRYTLGIHTVILLFCFSLFSAWAMSGGVFIVLLWTLLFACPTIILLSLVLQDPFSRLRCLQGFFIAAAGSVFLFFLQIIFGAETLDFRSNLSFRLPPHFGRGFALFPEVSTFAAHCILAFGACLAIGLHTKTGATQRRRALAFAGILLLALMFTRSSSVVVLLPLIVVLTVLVTQKPSLNTVLFLFLISFIGAALLVAFLQVFYMDRLENNAATRSAAMRLASILGGLSPLWRGEIFGVGIGENAQVSYRAYEAAKEFGLDFGKLPEGINSHIVTRIFEEGWPALLHMGVCAGMLFRARHNIRATPDLTAFYVIVVGAACVALMVIGYRGIYTNWIWLAGAAAWSIQHRAMPKRFVAQRLLLHKDRV